MFGLCGKSILKRLGLLVCVYIVTSCLTIFVAAESASSAPIRAHAVEGESCSQILAPSATGEFGNSVADRQRENARLRGSNLLGRLKGRYQFVFDLAGRQNNRLNHSEEVASIASEIALRLGLDASTQILVSSLGLAHDVGHTVFSHAGEIAFNSRLSRHGATWNHDDNTIRILKNEGGWSQEFLENLEMRGSMREKSSRSSVESQIVFEADRIANISSDLAEGLRAGKFLPTQLRTHFPLAYQQLMGLLGTFVREYKTATASSESDQLIKASIMADAYLMDYVYREFNRRLRESLISDLIRTSSSQRVGFAPPVRQQFSSLEKYCKDHIWTMSEPPIIKLVDHAIDLFLSGQILMKGRSAEIFAQARSEKEKIVIIADYMSENFSDHELLNFVRRNSRDFYRSLGISLEGLLVDRPIHSPASAWERLSMFLREREVAIVDDDENSRATTLFQISSDIAKEISKLNPELGESDVAKEILGNLSEVVRQLNEFEIQSYNRLQVPLHFDVQFRGGNFVNIRLRGTKFFFSLGFTNTKIEERVGPIDSYYAQVEIPPSSVQDLQFKGTHNLTNVRRNLQFLNQVIDGPWKVGLPLEDGGGKTWTFSDLKSSIYLSVKNPNDRRTVYIGLSLAEAEDAVKNDLRSSVSSAAQVTQYLALSPLQRVEQAEETIRKHKGGTLLSSLPMGGIPTMFIPTAADYRNAKFHGINAYSNWAVLELSVPQEVLWNPSVLVVEHRGEDELIIPFRVPQDWIIRIHQ